MIVLFRIDDRLLHGQVAFLWRKQLKFTHILVCSDSAANDGYTRQILNFSKPQECTLEIAEMRDAPERIRQLAQSEARGVVIVGSPADAAALADCLPADQRINIGTIRERPGSRLLGEYTALTQEDASYLLALLRRGREIWIGRYPSDPRQPLHEAALRALLEEKIPEAGNDNGGT